MDPQGPKGNNGPPGEDGSRQWYEWLADGIGVLIDGGEIAGIAYIYTRLEALQAQSTGNTASIVSVGTVPSGEAISSGLALSQIGDAAMELKDLGGNLNNFNDTTNSLLDNVNDSLQSVSNDFIPEQNMNNVEFQKYAENSNNTLRKMGRGGKGYTRVPAEELSDPNLNNPWDYLPIEV
jgi:hypothetical protein